MQAQVAGRAGGAAQRPNNQAAVSTGKPKNGTQRNTGPLTVGPDELNAIKTNSQNLSPYNQQLMAARMMKLFVECQK